MCSRCRCCPCPCFLSRWSCAIVRQTTRTPRLPERREVLLVQEEPVVVQVDEHLTDTADTCRHTPGTPRQPSSAARPCRPLAATTLGTLQQPPSLLLPLPPPSAVSARLGRARVRPRLGERHRHLVVLDPRNRPGLVPQPFREPANRTGGGGARTSSSRWRELSKQPGRSAAALRRKSGGSGGGVGARRGAPVLRDGRVAADAPLEHEPRDHPEEAALVEEALVDELQEALRAEGRPFGVHLPGRERDGGVRMRCVDARSGWDGRVDM